jgi:hypothetical protein
MKWSSLVALTVVLSACGTGQPDAQPIADAQAKSNYGSTANWNLDPALTHATVQGMRDRAYAYCLSDKVSDRNCFTEQDHSLFDYANTFRIVRTFRAEAVPTFEYAVAHKQDPNAFERVHRYCWSVYKDQRSRDARGLGPCMSAGVGADFFAVVPVS